MDMCTSHEPHLHDRLYKLLDSGQILTFIAKLIQPLVTIGTKSGQILTFIAKLIQPLVTIGTKSGQISTFIAKLIQLLRSSIWYKIWPDFDLYSKTDSTSSNNCYKIWPDFDLYSKTDLTSSSIW